jgi:Undecaprenyl-phosphate glucose phosphotransferase
MASHIFSIRKASSITGVMVYMLDILAVSTSGWAAHSMRFSGTAQEQLRTIDNLLIFSVAIFSAILFRKVYRMWPGGSLPSTVGRVSVVWGGVWVSMVVLMTLSKSAEEFSRLWLVSWLGLGLLFLAIGRILGFFIMASMRRAGYLHKTVILYGDSEMMDATKARIEGATWSGYEIVETVVPGDGKDIAQIDASLRPDEIWISLKMSDQMHLDSVLQSLNQSVANIRLLPDLMMYQILNHGMSVTLGIPMVDLSISPMFGGRKIAKAILDYSVAFAALLVLSPLMLLIALAIKFTSKGPIIFQQRRHGWNGSEIWVYKFRSMVVDQPRSDTVIQARQNDPRVTRIGRFLRKTSLDELPQFFNVLQGRMSVVGPRPHAVEHNNEYVQHIPRYALRHKVKPGITGWAQICGFRGETDTLDKMEGRIKHDLFYLENWSIWMDIKIIILTPVATIQNKNVY